MRKLLAAVVASAFVFGSLSGYAAEPAKKEELTKEQRADMRSRADKLTQEASIRLVGTVREHAKLKGNFEIGVGARVRF